MSQEKYVIVDVHPMDAFYDQKDILLGHIVTVRDDKLNHNYPTEIISSEYGSGHLLLEEDIDETFSKNDYIYFLAVMIEPLEDVMWERTDK